jgi:hypothetical protein
MSLDNEQKGHLRHVQLNVWETNILTYVAEHSGEILFDYRKVSEQVKDGIKNLIAKHLLSETVYDANSFKLRLTDQGRAIVSYIESLRVGRS